MLLQTSRTDQPDVASVQADAQTAFAALPAAYNQLATALNQFAIRHTLITAYPDLTQIAPVNLHRLAATFSRALVWCVGCFAQFASEQLFAPLNSAIQSTTGNELANIIGFLPGFLSHGYAAAVPWFRTESEAKMLQGSETSAIGLIPISRGGFHPNVAGLTFIAQSLYDAFATNG